MIKILLILLSFSFLACSEIDGDLTAEVEKAAPEAEQKIADALLAAENEYNICDRTNTIQAVILSQLIKKNIETIATENENKTVDTAVVIKKAAVNTQNTSLKKENFSDLTALKTLDLLAACKYTTKKQLASITELNLQGKNLTSLTNKDFSDLTGLKNLDLSNNNLTTLPEGIFHNLTNLNRINLSDNRLKNFPITTFNKWKNIKTTANNSMSNLPNLKFLDLRNNKLSDDFKNEFDETIRIDRKRGKWSWFMYSPFPKL